MSGSSCCALCNPVLGPLQPPSWGSGLTPITGSWVCSSSAVAGTPVAGTTNGKGAGRASVTLGEIPPPVCACSRTHTGSTTESAESARPQNTAARDNSLQTSGSSQRASALPERAQHVRSLFPLRKLPGRETAGQTSTLDILSIVNTTLRGKGCSQPSVKSQKQSFGDNRFLATPHPGAQEGGDFRWLPGHPAQASA